MAKHPLEDTGHIAWARLEQTNLDPDGGYDDRFLYFSAFVGSEAQLQRLKSQAQIHPPEGLRNASEELMVQQPGLALLKVDREVFTQRFFDGRPQRLDQWFQLRFTTSNATRAVAVISPGLRVRRLVAAAALVDLHELDDFFQAVFAACEADASKLHSMLIDASVCTHGHPSPIASVVDVGQGSMVALFANERPALFFDFGWPLSFYAASAPPTQPTPPAPIDAGVVLSHWDFDHWSFPFKGFTGGVPDWRVAEHEREWLVPGIGPNWGNVGLTPMAMAWALQLHHSSMLNVWPAKLRGITLNHLTIARTRSSRKTRGATNDNSLFMLVHEKVDPNISAPPKPRAILLPGDAAYLGIRRGLGRPLKYFDWRGLQATHHGAQLGGRLIPICTLPGPRELSHSWLAISAGTKAYGHPKAGTQARYSTTGNWRHQILTHNRVARVASNGTPDLRGNIELTIEDERQLNSGWSLSLAPRQ